jgi:hypothetical protein
MQLQTLLTIDCDELGEGYIRERVDNLVSLVRETGAVVVRLTGACGKDAALKDVAHEQLAKQGVAVL